MITLYRTADPQPLQLRLNRCHGHQRTIGMVATFGRRCLSWVWSPCR